MITIPKKFYVGLRPQEKGEGELPLAFLTPADDEHTKAFESRKSTVDRWADGYSWNKRKKIAPQTATNELLEGYKIAEDIRRVYWGGGNVVWRMIDPRGWEFEISSSNLARILDCGTVENGVIKGKCILGRDKAQNVLLPENSEPYVEATKNTQRAAKKISVKDVKPGDEVVLKDGREGVYLGVHYVVSSVYATERIRGAGFYGSTETTTRNFKDIKKRHFVRMKVTQEIKDKNRLYDAKLGAWAYIASADVHISEITKVAAKQLDAATVAAEITADLQTVKSRWDNLGDAYLVSNKPLTELTLKAIPYPMNEFSAAELERGRHPYAVLVPADGGGPLTISRQEYARSPHEQYRGYTIKLDEILRDGKTSYGYGGATVSSNAVERGTLVRIVAELDGKQYEIRTY